MAGLVYPLLFSTINRQMKLCMHMCMCTEGLHFSSFDHCYGNTVKLYNLPYVWLIVQAGHVWKNITKVQTISIKMLKDVGMTVP